MSKQAIVAVTGLNATDNPGPGVAAIRALRAHPDFAGRIIGLAYDALDPGIYARDLCDDIFLVPYPSHGAEALLARLRYIQRVVGGLNAIIPTLDAELPNFLALGDALAAMGVGTFLPTEQQLASCGKAKLVELGERTGLRVPAAQVLTSAHELAGAVEALGFPLVVKGIYYGAEIVCDLPSAQHAFARQAAKWGLPVIAQRFVAGQELDLLAVGDGAGGLLGALPMKKTVLTDKGKGWAGITICDEKLMSMARRFMLHSHWRGPCELEVIKDAAGELHLLEINPRFPAWCYLSAGAGMNLPYLVLQRALGQQVAPLSEYRVGTLFIRIALDQIATLEDLAAITQHGQKLSAEEHAA